jgi:hypothetical protein
LTILWLRYTFTLSNESENSKGCMVWSLVTVNEESNLLRDWHLCFTISLLVSIYLLHNKSTCIKNVAIRQSSKSYICIYGYIRNKMSFHSTQPKMKQVTITQCWRTQNAKHKRQKSKSFPLIFPSKPKVFATCMVLPITQ